MGTPTVTIGCVSNLFSRQMVFNAVGDTEHGHMHTFDHLTLLAAGSLSVEVDGGTSEFKAPYMIYIHKDKKHKLVALESNTVAYCIHALRNSDKSGDILDPTMIPEGVNAVSLADDLVRHQS